MIDIKVIQYLNDVMEEPAYGMIPEVKPARYAVVELVKSGIKNHISRASVTVYCYARTKADAALYAESVRDAMLDMDVLPEITSSKLGNLTAGIDPGIKEPRYEVTVNLWYYE